MSEKRQFIRKVMVWGPEGPGGAPVDEDGFWPVYWLMEDDGSPQGKYLMTLTYEEAVLRRPKE